MLSYIRIYGSHLQGLPLCTWILLEHPTVTLSYSTTCNIMEIQTSWTFWQESLSGLNSDCQRLSHLQTLPRYLNKYPGALKADGTYLQAPFKRPGAHLLTSKILRNYGDTCRQIVTIHTTVYKAFFRILPRLLDAGQVIWVSTFLTRTLWLFSSLPDPGPPLFQDRDDRFCQSSTVVRSAEASVGLQIV